MHFYVKSAWFQNKPELSPSTVFCWEEKASRTCGQPPKKCWMINCGNMSCLDPEPGQLHRMVWQENVISLHRKWIENTCQEILQWKNWAAFGALSLVRPSGLRRLVSVKHREILEEIWVEECSPPQWAGWLDCACLRCLLCAAAVRRQWPFSLQRGRASSPVSALLATTGTQKKHFVCDGLLKLPREKTVKSRRGAMATWEV